MKKSFAALLIGILAAAFFAGSVFLAEAGSPDPSESRVPDWLKRTDFGFQVETGIKPRFYLETVQPLYQSEDKIETVFTHDRVSLQDGRGTYSVGIGYRRLLRNETILAGINTFFDYQDLHRHHRQGIGLELLGEIFEARANTYIALSPKRIVHEVNNGITYERAADGFDVELGAPAPYFPWIKLFGSYFWYDYKNFEDKKGWKMRGEIKPFEFLTINLVTVDDNKGTPENSIDCRFRLAFADFTFRDFLSNFKLSDEPFPKTDLKERTLDRVERSFEIEVERWEEKGGVTIEVGRR